jgi:hypothetical protein
MDMRQIYVKQRTFLNVLKCYNVTYQGWSDLFLLFNDSFTQIPFPSFGHLSSPQSHAQKCIFRVVSKRCKMSLKLCSTINKTVRPIVLHQKITLYTLTFLYKCVVNRNVQRTFIHHWVHFICVCADEQCLAVILHGSVSTQQTVTWYRRKQHALDPSPRMTSSTPRRVVMVSSVNTPYYELEDSSSSHSTAA